MHCRKSVCAFVGLLVFLLARSGISETEGLLPYEEKNFEEAPPAKEPQLSLASTFGALGGTRDAPTLPGEKIHITASLVGLSTDPAGKIEYSVKSRLLDAKGNELAKSDPSYSRANKPPEGNFRVTHIYYGIPRTLDPGKYRVQVEATDRVSGAVADREMEVEILPKSSLGVLDLKLSEDEKGTSPVFAIAPVGERMYLTGIICGFSKETDHYRINCTLGILDNKGQLLLGYKPKTSTIEGDTDSPDAGLPIGCPLEIGQTGEYVIQFDLEDLISGKKAKYRVPVKMHLGKDRVQNDSKREQN